MLYSIIALVLLVADQVVKYLVRTGIDLGQSIPFIPHLLDLTYVQNTGAAFSILREHTWLLTLISAVVVVVIAVLVQRKFFQGWLGLTAAMLVMCGGVGNLIDRVVLGYVTDMFQTTFMNFAVFNLADCYITIGVVLLFLYVLFFYPDSNQKEVEPHGDCDLPDNGT
ncbi:signal peptidase II [Pseudoflavonifractor sp. An85]|uniref:signal peptidase II n=1 Tax=Pseudoflavonifractor sp. An85 TaxID=1965661 RepID=UPI000B3AFCC4|nr:signal peptidase II [Pseudoflavonifractor sp. An85]OUN19870.1 signal peptidase II [Pseudoflavonifractor sp. An85]